MEAAVTTRDGIALTRLLRNISEESGRLAQIAENLDYLLGEMASGQHQLSSEFQNVDMLRQSLQALKQITAAVANELPWHADLELPKAALAMGVTLEKLREACLATDDLSTVQPRSSAHHRTETGDPAFFDEF